MLKFIRIGLVISVMFAAASVTQATVAKSSASAPDLSTASEVIDLVNSLRASHGLPPYRTDAILMSITQTHAEYMASIGVSTVHVDALGRRPFQRALAAGYLVAGNLSLGGWYSENVAGGVGMTPQEVVDLWMGDAPHQETMLSDVHQDAGAGVAVVGDTYYYCLDTALSTGGTPVAYTPPPSTRIMPTIIPNTPNADGSIVHIIQPNDTILAIAAAYHIPVNDILRLNNLKIDSIIYPGHKLIISPAFTPTPTSPTSTPTLRPRATLWPTSTAQATSTLTAVASAEAAGPSQPIPAAAGAVIAITICAFVAAGIVTRFGSRGRK